MSPVVAVRWDAGGGRLTFLPRLAAIVSAELLGASAFAVHLGCSLAFDPGLCAQERLQQALPSRRAADVFQELSIQGRLHPLPLISFL